MLLQHISQTYRGTGLSGFTGGTLETLRTLWFWGEKGKKKGGKNGLEKEKDGTEAPAGSVGHPPPLPIWTGIMTHPRGCCVLTHPVPPLPPWGPMPGGALGLLVPERS